MIYGSFTQTSSGERGDRTAINKVRSKREKRIEFGFPPRKTSIFLDFPSRVEDTLKRGYRGSSRTVRSRYRKSSLAVLVHFLRVSRVRDFVAFIRSKESARAGRLTCTALFRAINNAVFRVTDIFTIGRSPPTLSSPLRAPLLAPRSARLGRHCGAVNWSPPVINAFRPVRSCDAALRRVYGVNGGVESAVPQIKTAVRVRPTTQWKIISETVNTRVKIEPNRFQKNLRTTNGQTVYANTLIKYVRLDAVVFDHDSDST